MRQTTETIENGPRLNLRGPYYEAGTYSDVAHKHLTKNPIGISFSVPLERNIKKEGNISLVFDADEPQLPRLARLRISVPDNPPVEVRRGRGADGPFELHIGGQKIPAKGILHFPQVGGIVGGIFPFFFTESKPDRIAKPLAVAQKAMFSFRRALKNIRAVGAFRKQPERRYEYQGRLPDSPDIHGDRAVNAIIEDSLKRGGGKFVREVDRWLREVGRVRLLRIRRISRAARIFEVRLRDTDSGRWANFADVGFGVGQAFPVFVEGLRTPIGGTFLVQEPEIHLHPDAQLAMANFLVQLALSGRQVIAETHSENLLLRVRALLLASKNTNKNKKSLHLSPDMVSILHVNKDNNGESHIHQLSIDEMGQISNWPAGFMEEATSERIRLLEEMSKIHDTTDT
jgi:hypothetical protein